MSPSENHPNTHLNQLTPNYQHFTYNLEYSDIHAEFLPSNIQNVSDLTEQVHLPKVILLTFKFNN